MSAATAPSWSELQAAYPAAPRARLQELAQAYEKRREQDLLEIAAVATELTAEAILEGLESAELDPIVRAAIAEAAPNLLQQHGWDGLDDHLRAMEPDQLQGFVSMVKGKVFELEVVNRLNGGERVGELLLPDGHRAVMAESPIQPGWDVAIVDESGSFVEVLSMKATDSLGPIRRAIERYPDIRIATTSEIDGASEFILQTDIDDATLEAYTTNEIEEYADSWLADFTDGTVDLVGDAIPVLPGLIVVFSEGRALLAGRSDMENSVKRAAQRLKRPAIMSSVGAVLFAMDMGVVSVPVTVAGHVLWTRAEQRQVLSAMLAPQRRSLNQVIASMQVAA